MEKNTDQELLDELKMRFEENHKNIKRLVLLNEQLVEVNRKLTESEKLKSNFLSNIRNEIINPLSSILNLSQNIANNKNMAEGESVKQAAIIYSDAFDLDFQLNNVFSSAEIEAGESVIETYKIDMNELINSEIKKFTDYALRKNITIEFVNQVNNDGGDCVLKSDPGKIRLILENLIVNAINWSNNDAKVILTLKKYDKGFILIVRDFGKGIAKGYHNVIFDRFKRVDPTVFTDNKGQGLGLSIVKAYLEQLDGEITLDSELGRGSAFSVKIPQALSETKSEGYSMGGQDFIFDEGELF